MKLIDMTYLFALALIGALLIGLGFYLAKKPKSEGDWKAPLARAASFSPAPDGSYKLQNFRAFEFTADKKYSEHWSEIDINSKAIKEMWFFIEPFPTNALFAHSFISFVFDDGKGGTQSIAVSIEARMERDQSYTPLGGVFRNYELLYVWSTEKDIMTRIGVSLDNTLYAYKLDLSHDQQRTLLEYFITRTNLLAEQPRFYNTLHSNCTNELAKAVNEAFPNALPWHRSWVLTGRSAKWLSDLGFIKTQPGISFKTASQELDIREIVQRLADEPAADFEVKWRQSLAAKINNTPTPSPRN